MRVDEAIRLLQKLPGDYSIGVIRFPVPGQARFQHLEPVVGVNNETRRVSLGFASSVKIPVEEYLDTFEVTL